MSLEIGIGGALLAGLLSFFSPCVLPLVPPYLAFLAGVSFEEFVGDGRGCADGRGRPDGGASAVRRARRRVVLAALAFVAGFATVFVLLGATASTLGQWLAAWYDPLRWIAGSVIILFGLHFLGVLRIPLLLREARIEVARRPASLAGAYLIGLAFAFGWTPCVGPVLAAILFTAGAQDTAREGAVLLAAYAAGIGVPFVAAAFFAGPFVRLMRRMRAHLGRVEKVMGAFLVATGILFITNTMSTISYWLLDFVPALG